MPRKKPLIGITTRPADANEFHMSVDVRFVDYVERAGGVAVALPFSRGSAENAEELVGRLDGLLLTGGGDICEDAFGGRAYEDCSHAPLSYTSPERDAFEEAAVLAAWRADLPVLGVCRGMQVMCVALGGRMVRDISELPGEHLDHARYDLFEQTAHGVRVEPGTRLARILGATELGVNSRHHQAITTPAPGSRVVAWATDGIPEGVEFDGRRFFVGVQWHPEMLLGAPELFEALVDAAREDSP